MRSQRVGVVIVFGVLTAACVGSSTTRGPDDGQAATNTAVAPTTTMAGGLTPITGYGDYSEIDWHDLDFYEVVALIHRCANDHGFPVRLIPPGDGLDYQQIPPELNEAASETVDRCAAGLNLPEPHRRSPDELIALHQFWAEETIPCIEALGHTVPELPSVEYFVEHYYHDPYHPHEHVSGAGDAAYAEALLACPPSPVTQSASDDD